MLFIINWLTHNVEIIGAVAGLIYVFLSIKQNIALWPVGIIASILYVIVFFCSTLYANMGLQLYYVIMSIYGWVYWKRISRKGDITEKPKVQIINNKLFSISLCIGLIINLFVWWVLKNYTNSPSPILDSVTTTLSIIGTWMLARKYIENWIIWIVTDLLSVSLYFQTKLYATSILYAVYAIMAILGYFEWKKVLSKAHTI